MIDTMDADVCIDLLREKPYAEAWFNALPVAPAISGFVAMELLAGAQSRREYQEVAEFIDDLQVVWASEVAMQAATRFFLPYQLSHGVGVLDCLIAATAKEQGGTLYTFNTKHFRPLPGVMIAEPYMRSVSMP